MCAAWKKKNARNKIVRFYCTQPDILLCGIARFSRGNKNKLRKFQPQKWKKIKTASLKQNLLVLIKKEECIRSFPLNYSRCDVTRPNLGPFFVFWKFVSHFNAIIQNLGQERWKFVYHAQALIKTLTWMWICEGRKIYLSDNFFKILKWWHP